MEGSFFEKLKKGMGVEESMEEQIEKKEKSIEKKEKPKRKLKKSEIKTVSIELEAEEKPRAEKVVKEEKIEEKKILKEEKSSAALAKKDKEKWPEPEGQLAIDVYQTESDLIIQSAIAGVSPENLDVSIEKDLLTIRGKRKRPDDEEGDYFSQECYWGAFSREMILPVEVDPGRVEATLKEGILTIRIPKIMREKKTKIVIKG